MKKRIESGSMTLEGAILIPVFFAIVGLACTMGISLYKEIESNTEQELVDGMWEVKNFYLYKGVNQIVND